MTELDLAPLLRAWDGEEVIIRFDQPAASWIFIAIHSTLLGPAAGGTRLKAYPHPRLALADALQLAASMTYKYAAADFPRGGGKAVIAVPSDLEPTQRQDLLRRYGALIKQLGGLYFTGPDVGTAPEDMDMIAETGAPYVHCRTEARGGAGGSGPATALGVFTAIETTCRQLFGTASLAGRSVLVQGAGSVGAPLIERLLAAGARVAFSDVDAETIRRLRDQRGLEFVPPEEIADVACDVFAPCAMGGILDAETIARLRCRAVVGGANNQLATPADAERLADRGILYAPDFVVNIGGAMAITGIEAMGWSPARAEDEVKRIGVTLSRVFTAASAAGITTEAAARALARARLDAARS